MIYYPGKYPRDLVYFYLISHITIIVLCHKDILKKTYFVENISITIEFYCF